MRLVTGILMLVLVVTATGCTILQEVKPTGFPEGATLCILENNSVRAGFLREYRKTLAKFRIGHRVVSEYGLPPETCEWTSTYTGRWSWDLALYMSFAEIKVFRNNVLNGQALYDASEGSGNLGKFIIAEAKIRELVTQLFQPDSVSEP